MRASSFLSSSFLSFSILTIITKKIFILTFYASNNRTYVALLLGQDTLKLPVVAICFCRDACVALAC